MKNSRLLLLTPLALAFAGAVLAQAPEISFDSTPNLLKLPEHIYLGEAAGVATNSKGHIFVYTRTGDPYAITGGSRVFTHGGARLFEFDQNGKYVREIGQGLYGFLFAQAVRIDPQDNIWVVDRGSSQVIKFDPEGRVAMAMGRKPEAIFVGTRGGGLEAAVEDLRRADEEAVAGPVEVAQAELSAVARLPHPAQALPAISSISLPTWPGIRPAIFSSPTATATRASPSSIKTANS